MDIEIADLVARALVLQAAAIETACEQALQLGDRGVRVVRYRSDPTIIEVGPDLGVPYGQLHEVLLDRPPPRS